MDFAKESEAIKISPQRTLESLNNSPARMDKTGSEFQQRAHSPSVIKKPGQAYVPKYIRETAQYQKLEQMDSDINQIAKRFEVYENYR